MSTNESSQAEKPGNLKSFTEGSSLPGDEEMPLPISTFGGDDEVGYGCNGEEIERRRKETQELMQTD